MRVTVLGPAEELLSSEELPFFRGGVRAGFPSPADDYLEGNLSLQDMLIEHPAATFLIKVEGHSMKDAGIFDGDIAVVDRALHPSNGRIVVAVVDGEFCLKRLVYREGRCFLESANASFKPIEVSDCSENQIWGVVKHVIHTLR